MSSLEKNIGESFLIRSIEWGLDHPRGFSVSEVTEAEELELSAGEKDILKTYLQIAHKNYYNVSVVRSGPVNPDTLFLALYILNPDNYADEKNKYVISLESQFNFIDYQELKFARKNASEAKRLSFGAIVISIIAILIPIFSTQDVEISEQQMERFLNHSNSVKIDDQQLNAIILSRMEGAKINDEQIKIIPEVLGKNK